MLANDVGNEGTQTHNMTFTPADLINYNTVDNNVSVTVNPASITNAEITVTVPTTGLAPNTTATGAGNFSIGMVSWSPNHYPFQGSTQYAAEVMLTANSGYTFPD